MTTKRRISRHSGVSLAEVLVSIMIMSIGVILLSTLLPISILRTAQATQLTQAVFLRNNAEAAIESNQGLIDNSQICGFNGVGIVDPLGYFLTGPNTTSTTFGGYSSLAPATRIIRASGGIQLNKVIYPPSGYTFNVAQGDTALTNFNSTQLALAMAQADQLATLPDSWTSVHSDTITAYNPATSTITIRSLTTDLAVRNGQNPQNALYRIVMYDISNFAVVRQLFRTGGTSPTIGSKDLSWQNVDSSGTLVTSPGIPNGFTPVRVRIEVRDRRFSWLMTVRKRWVPNGPILGLDNAPGIKGTDDDNRNGVDDNGEIHIAGSDDDPYWAAEIDVAVFFNRSFKANDETSHSTLLFKVNVNGTNYALGFDQAAGVAGVDDDGNGLTDWTDNTKTVPDPGEIAWLGSDDNRTVAVDLGNKPYIKKGGYMLEPSLLKWYRITQLNGDTSPATVLFDQDIRNSSSISQGIFMKGIVEVYSLGARTGQQ